MLFMEESRKIFTLTELAKSLSSVIDKTYSKSYWIRAEIAKLNFYPHSGHCYPDLVDKTADQITAQMRAIIWSKDYIAAKKEFIRLTGDPLKEGMQILFLAKVTFHPVHGLSLLITNIDPTVTLGQMALQKQNTIQRLKKEGVFGANQLLAMPLLPKRIAVISVETSKGFQDFREIIQSQSKRFGIFYHLFPAMLQGDRAVESISLQLRKIRRLAGFFDMVAIIRGGGGDVGLNSYDNYNLAREIALFPIPVLTGIGHATNLTVSEMVAWKNKITPTDVAYFIIGKFDEFEQRLNKARERISIKAGNTLYNHQRNLQRKASMIQMLSTKTLEKHFQHLKHLENKLVTGSERLLEQNYRLLEHLNSKIQLLDPIQILKRGYSITMVNGKSINSISEIESGQQIKTLLADGILVSDVKKKVPLENLSENQENTMIN
jgi:exodeoxyribonuclease VII large subunit